MAGSRTAKKVGAWIWLLIYGGLILGGLGLSIARGDAALGWCVVVVGSVSVVVGVVLVWVRSRMND
ncbi:MAG TPA: hypothetical protein VNU71_03275 [Burkholderiaceae bacterium]|nr:hypothetical protein [Burkholderiaceae bacterium]